MEAFSGFGAQRLIRDTHVISNLCWSVLKRTKHPRRRQQVLKPRRNTQAETRCDRIWKRGQKKNKRKTVQQKQRGENANRGDDKQTLQTKTCQSLQPLIFMVPCSRFVSLPYSSAGNTHQLSGASSPPLPFDPCARHLQRKTCPSCLRANHPPCNLILRPTVFP